MKVTVDFSEKKGKIKPMHAVNNGPIPERSDQTKGNFDDFKRAKIPYARTHDSNSCYDYGAPHTIDVTAIFPDFDADENDEKNYDFYYTDFYCKNIVDAGTQVFYRLGQGIEHGGKKYGIYPPKDYAKWARICEHIILHLNYGWANGLTLGIKYWEIWNEPDLDPDDGDYQRTWYGTLMQFCDLFEVAAKYLKGKFPELKIGGPSFAGEMDRIEKCITESGKRKVPLDFISWHCYTTNPYKIAERAEKIRKIMDENGYKTAESICNEWNYVKGWSNEFIYSLKKIIEEKGAAFTAQTMSLSQNSSMDMLMYYDARPTGFNGLFNQELLHPLKGYYPFLYWSVLFSLKTQYVSETDDKRLTVTAAKNEKGEAGIFITYYCESDDDTATEALTVKIKGDVINKTGKVFVTDSLYMNNYTRTITAPEFTLKVQPNSVIFITFGDLYF